MMIKQELLKKIKADFYEEFKQRSQAILICKFEEVNDKLTYDDLVESYSVNKNFAEELEDVYMLYAVGAAKTIAEKFDRLVLDTTFEKPTCYMKDLVVTLDCAAGCTLSFILPVSLLDED